MELSDKVLITGIEGFTGYHLSRYLRQKGFSVFGLSYLENQLGADVFKCDITKIHQVRELITIIKPDFIIHLAGISFTASENIEDIYSINVGGTLNILDICMELAVLPKKIVLASSATVYGNQFSGVLSEEMCPKPNSHYGNSKLAMENMSRNYFGALNIVIVRPFNYTGPKQASNFIIPKLVQHFKEREHTIELGNIDVHREFNDINYIVELYHRVMVSSHSSEIVNFCSGKTYSLTKIISELEDVTGHNIKIRINQEFVRSNEIKSLCGSTDNLRIMLGEIPDLKPLKETLIEMLK
jgi:GDP-6-deoxy-D-talose 4-dehydrogenase